MPDRIKYILILCIGVFLLLPTVGFSAENPSATLSQGNSYLSDGPRNIVHTVQKNETLWEIARKFDVDITRVAQWNHLANPDLIFPGDDLVIEVQDDLSVRIRTNDPLLNPRPASKLETPDFIAHVIYPDKNDIFSPENPLVVYEATETISIEPRREETSTVKVFQTFFEFIAWLSGESDASRQAKATQSNSIDPSPSSPYAMAQSVNLKNPLAARAFVPDPNTLYRFSLANSLSPPPRFL